MLRGLIGYTAVAFLLTTVVAAQTTPPPVTHNALLKLSPQEVGALVLPQLRDAFAVERGFLPDTQRHPAVFADTVLLTTRPRGGMLCCGICRIDSLHVLFFSGPPKDGIPVDADTPLKVARIQTNKRYFVGSLGILAADQAATVYAAACDKVPSDRRTFSAGDDFEAHIVASALDRAIGAANGNTRLAFELVCEDRFGTCANARADLSKLDVRKLDSVNLRLCGAIREGGAHCYDAILSDGDEHTWSVEITETRGATRVYMKRQ